MRMSVQGNERTYWGTLENCCKSSSHTYRDNSGKKNQIGNLEPFAWKYPQLGSISGSWLKKRMFVVAAYIEDEN